MFSWKDVDLSDDDDDDLTSVAYKGGDCVVWKDDDCGGEIEESQWSIL
jgi:hypothetical protein